MAMATQLAASSTNKHTSLTLHQVELLLGVCAWECFTASNTISRTVMACMPQKAATQQQQHTRARTHTHTHTVRQQNMICSSRPTVAVGALEACTRYTAAMAMAMAQRSTAAGHEACTWRRLDARPYPLHRHSLAARWQVFGAHPGSMPRPRSHTCGSGRHEGRMTGTARGLHYRQVRAR